VQLLASVVPTSLSQARLWLSTVAEVLLPQVPVLLMQLSAALQVSVSVSQCLLLQEEPISLAMTDLTLQY